MPTPVNSQLSYLLPVQKTSGQYLSSWSRLLRKTSPAVFAASLCTESCYNLQRQRNSLNSNSFNYLFIYFSFFFQWHYSPLWTLPCRTIPFNFFLSVTNSLHLLTPSTWRSLSTSSFHLFLGFTLHLVASSSWVKIFLDVLSSSVLSRWHNQLTLCPFIHLTIFSPLLISSSSRFVRLFHSPFSYIGPYIVLNIFLSKISRDSSSVFVNVHASAPYDTAGLINVLYDIILVALDKSRLLKRLIAAKQFIYFRNCLFLFRQSFSTLLFFPLTFFSISLSVSII